MPPTAADLAPSVSVCVRESSTSVNCAKTVETIEMPFGGQIRVDLRTKEPCVK